MSAPDPTATFEAFYRNQHERLLCYFRKRVGRDAAPDLVQETFMRLLRNGGFDRLDNPRAYLTRCAHNLLTESARRQWREQAVFCPFDEGRDAAVFPQQTLRLDEIDAQQLYQQALDDLPPKTRRIFLMHRVQCMTYKEIGTQLGIGDNGVQYHMMRALARCRQAAAAQM